VTVGFELGYVSAFSEVQFTPRAERVTDKAYEVILPAVRPGESRRVTVSLRADRYGLHRGVVSAAARDGAAARAEVSTWIFP
jgi:tRNA threonylcarbamoyladenosine modification (KEOPS) complex  Pcc1 subunit